MQQNSGCKSTEEELQEDQGKQPKYRYAETAQPGQRFNQNVTSPMDQHIMTSEDELMDDTHLKTNLQLEKVQKMPNVTKSQYNLQF